MNEQTLLPPKLASRDDLFQRAYADLASRLIEFGDLADEADRQDLADKVASVGTRLSLLKLAQYEGFTNYWVANGRAFERAYKEKASKPGASPHEAWWAVLEEYQESLPGNQSKFNEKYAAVNLDGESAKHLAEAIVDRIEQHGSPSVAFYQAIHDVSTGKTILACADELSSVLDEARGDEKLAKAASDLESSVSEAIRTAGITDWLGRGVNWLGKAFDPIAEGVDRFEMGAMGAGGPIVNAGVKIKHQFEKIKEVVRYMRTGDPQTTANKDFAKSFLLPIKKELNLFSGLAKAAGIAVPNYDQLVSHLNNGSELNAGNVENFFPVMSAVYRLTENQPLLEKMYKAYLRRQKAMQLKHQRGKKPATAPAAAPIPATAPAAGTPAPAPAMTEVGPEFVGNFMGAIENAKKLNPKQYNLLRSIVNRILMRQKQIEAPQIVRQPGIAAESTWSIKTAAVSIDDLLEQVLDAYERISGKPLLTPDAIDAVKKNLGTPAAGAKPVVPTTAPDATAPVAPAPAAPTGTATPASATPAPTATAPVPTPGATGKAPVTYLSPEQQKAKDYFVDFAVKWLSAIPENDPILKQLYEGLTRGGNKANVEISNAIMDLRANNPGRARAFLSRLGLIHQLAVAGDNDTRSQVLDEYQKPDKGVLTRTLASAIASSGLPAIAEEEKKAG